MYLCVTLITHIYSSLPTHCCVSIGFVFLTLLLDLRKSSFHSLPIDQYHSKHLAPKKSKKPPTISYCNIQYKSKRIVDNPEFLQLSAIASSPCALISPPIKSGDFTSIALQPLSSNSHLRKRKRKGVTSFVMCYAFYTKSKWITN